MNLVTAYAADAVVIAGRRITAPCIVAPGTLLTEWIADLSSLGPEALAPVLPLAPRILLLGSERGAAAVDPALRRWAAARQIALEPMDLGAACRTYNVLAQEDRAAAALLFPQVPPGS